MKDLQYITELLSKLSPEVGLLLLLIVAAFMAKKYGLIGDTHTGQDVSSFERIASLESRMTSAHARLKRVEDQAHEHSVDIASIKAIQNERKS